jgi:hypothetical protein
VTITTTFWPVPNACDTGLTFEQLTVPVTEQVKLYVSPHRPVFVTVKVAWPLVLAGRVRAVPSGVTDTA